MITKENALDFQDMVESVDSINRNNASLTFARPDSGYGRVFYLRTYIDLDIPMPHGEININYFGSVFISGRLDSDYTSPASPIIYMRIVSPEFGNSRYSRKPYIGEVFDEYFQENFPKAFRNNGVPIDYTTYNKWETLFDYQEYNPRQIIKDLERTIKALREFWTELNDVFDPE